MYYSVVESTSVYCVIQPNIAEALTESNLQRIFSLAFHLPII